MSTAPELLLVLVSAMSWAATVGGAYLSVRWALPLLRKRVDVGVPDTLFAMALVGFTVCRLFELITTPWSKLAIQTLVSDLVTNIALLATCLGYCLFEMTSKSQPFIQLETNIKVLTGRKQLFEQFMNQVPAMVYIKNFRGKVLYINNFVKDLLGLEPAEVMGKDKFDWQQAGFKESLKMQALHVIESGEKMSFTGVVSKNDIKRHVMISKFPLIGRLDERLLGCITIDITEEVNRKNRIDALAAIVELSPDAMYCYDEYGKVFFWNAAAEHLYGYTKEEMLGKSMLAICPPARKMELEQVIEIVRTKGELREFETVRVTKSGAEIPVTLSASRTYTHRGDLLCAVMVRDISKLNRIKNEIASVNETLTEQVKQLSRANANLQKARDEALRASNVKSAFVANISHELRTPLSGILGMSELASRSESLTGDTHYMVHLIHQSAMALLRLVNEILDLSKLEAGKMTMELDWFSPVELLQESVALVRPATAHKQVMLAVSVGPDVPDLVRGDGTKVRQIILSLLGNAVKFTAKGSISVDMNAAALPGGGCELSIAVTDTGIGISSSNMEQIFTPFSAVGTPGAGPGLGLGLVLSKRFIELMEGTIGCESEPGRGSRFWIKIPFAALIAKKDTQELSCIEELPTQSDLAKFRVLTVEDSPMLSRLTMRQLQIIGVYAETASTVKEAVAKVAAGNFDLILMDVHLPDGTGYDATRQIRNLGYGQRSRPIVIAMTAGILQNERNSALAAGMDDFLSKPVTLDALRRTIMNWIKKVNK